MKPETPQTEPEPKERREVNTKEIYHLSVTADGANFKLAPCCSPIPGDDVMGYVDDDGIVEIHSLDCPRAQVLKAGFGSRIVATDWATVEEKFLAHIRYFRK